MTTTTHAQGAARPAANLLDPAFYVGDPHDAFTWMRANEPVYRDQVNDLWAVTRHADIRDVEGRPAEFVSSQGYRSFHSPGETNMIAQDDPRHLDQRKLVSRRFTPKAVRDHEPWLRATSLSLVEQMVGSVADGAPGVEVVDALAAQLPCRLTAWLLGWDEARWPDIKSWSERLMRYDAIAYDQDAMVGMMQAIMEFNPELQAMAEERRGCPFGEDSDLVTVWANATIDGEPLDAESVMHETGLFISGGAETTRTLIARGLRAFCDHPDQWEALAENPAAIPDAIEEMIRWVTPLNNFFRTAVVDTQIGEQAVEAGDRVILLYPSANRDEAVFDDPFTFDIARRPNPHVGFGFGTHFCLGASLARLEMQVLMEELVARITNLRVVTEIDREANIFATGARSFTLGFDIRSAPAPV
jgi:cytochrome P450 family 142 subfamily A polypeptide 1